jgi:RNA polymerase sigma factor (sigma-70 family)
VSIACGDVLLVEGDIDSRTTIAALLERRGYRVRQAADGEEALDLARRGRPTLVLLEVSLRDISGYEVCRQLRAEFGAALPIVFISGNRIEPHDRAVGLRLGADDYITKPFDAEELLARVDRLIANATPHAGRQEAQRHGETAVPRLSRRELEVLQLLADGHTTKEIARSLGVSRKTVSNHVQSILAKLGVHSQAQAVAAAFNNGMATRGGRQPGRPL